ncbi:MAG TPA: VOC family protein [Bryobacteraceae bacterium]|nr:VOC family protein [Bryobacteraceae bacterium]
MPRLGRVLETSLYVEDLDRSIDFYQRLFGFSKLVSDARFCAFSVSGQQVLLLFRKHGTIAPIATPGGVIPPHDGQGQLHLAFTIPLDSETEWMRHLSDHEVAIESRVAWPRGGFSLYFRDLDGHLLELVSPGCWAIY